MAGKGITRKADYKPGDEVRLTERERQVLDLRITGKSFREIAEIVGYANEGGAYKAVQRALQATIQEPADELRRIEGERLNELFEVAFARATGGGDKALLAIDRCLQIQARRAALLGLDAPIRIEEHVISEDAVDAELRRLSEQIAERGGAVPVE